jgi:acetolactate synthase-1/2/3 large subunit
MSSRLPVGKVIVNSLIDLNVECVFGLPGTHIYHVFKELEEVDSITTIITRHETNAVFMADVYGRLKGRPGISIVTAGPGFTNALTGIGQAFAVSSPVLVVSGDVPTGRFYDFHGVDVPNILSSMSGFFCKDSITVYDSSEVEWTIKNGYFYSNTGRKGPVHICIPRDILSSTSEYRSLSLDYQYKFDDLGIHLDWDRYISGKVLLVIGPEASYPEYREIINDFVDSVGCPFISEVSTIGFISQDSILFGGFYEKDFVLHPLSYELFRDADTIIFLGIRQESVDSEYLVNISKKSCNTIFVTPGLNPKGSLGMIEDEMIMSTSMFYGRDCLSIYGPIEYILHDIIERNIISDEFNIDLRAGILERYERIVDEISKYRSTKPMNQGSAIHIISEYLPPHTNLLVDVGANEIWARDLIAPVRDVRYLYAGGYGSLGFAFGGAIGSKLADYESPTVSITGDGSLLMSLMEVPTVVYYGIPLHIYVINDGSYGILEHLSRREFEKPLSSYIGYVDFAKYADACGLESVVAESTGELEDILRELKSRMDKSILVDIRCRKEDIPPFLR